MPFRSELLKKGWPAAELPVVPFLAPRVFTPWPWSGRRLHSAAQFVGSRPESTAQKNIRWLQNNAAGGEAPSYSSTRLKQCQNKDVGTGQGSTEHTSKDVTNDKFINIDENRGHRDITNETGDELPEEFAKPNFVKKYQEIWGSPDSNSSQGNEQKALVRFVEAGTSKRKCSGHYSIRIRNVRNGSHIWHKEATKCFTEDRKDRSTSAHRHSRPLRRPRTKEMSNFLSNEATFRGSDVPRKSTKWVAAEGAFGFWHKAFAHLIACFPNSTVNEFQLKLIGNEKPIFPQLVKRNLIISDQEALHEQWKSLSQGTRIQMWPELMMEALQYHPEEALNVLIATYSNNQDTPGYAVTDSLEYIISYCLTNADVGKARVAFNLQEKVTSFLSQYPTDRLHLSQKTIYELLSNIGDDHLAGFYNTLIELKQPLHANTLMHFLSRFSKSGETDLGFQILEALGSCDVDFSSPQMMSVCSSLLHAPTQGQSSPATNSKRFQFMLSHGMRPNIVTYNILIQNALQAGDTETGWQIHDLMVEQAITPDAYTYSILLNDAKLRMDPLAIKSVMAYLRSNSIKSPYLVTDVLHTIMLLHLQGESGLVKHIDSTQPPETAFKRMLDVYCEHYSLDPLHHLIPDLKMKYPSPNSVDLRVTTHNSYADPPSPTLIVMIAGYLGELDSKATLELYQHFHRLVRSGDKLGLSLMTTTHIWNTFLLALGKFPDTVFDCPKIIGMMIATTPIPTTAKVKLPPAIAGANQTEQAHTVESSMLENFPESSAVELDVKGAMTLNLTLEAEISDVQQLGQPPVSREIDDSQSQILPTISQNVNSLQNQGCVQPDIYTWTILLKVFADHRLPRAAEKVLSAMQQRNITPNLITWNTLAFGYSRSQNVAMLADTVDRMAQAGFKPDEATMKALVGIRDRRKLIEAMSQEEVEGGNLDMTSSIVGKRFVRSLKYELKQDRPEMAPSIDRNWR